jgi:hypothetical protein
VIVELALLVAGAIVASELFLRLPLMRQVASVVDLAQRSAATLRSKGISDHWKEVALPAYSLRIAARSIFFFVLLCCVVLPVALIGVVAPGGLAHWLEQLTRPFALVVLCFCSILYILVRTRLARG